MLSAERHRRLVQHLRLHGSGNVTDLAEQLGVSSSTIRRDLRELDERGLVERSHGGASAPAGDEPQLQSRVTSHSAEKETIGRAAARMVQAPGTILITGGSTTEAMVPYLAAYDGLTVVTNALNIAWQLTRLPQLTVVVLGGVLRHGENSLLGTITEQALSQLHIDQVFTGALGIDPDSGISGAHVQEAGTDRSLLASARQVVCLIDSSKFGRRGPVRLADITGIDAVVTDGGADPTVVGALEAHGVRVTLAT